MLNPFRQRVIERIDPEAFKKHQEGTIPVFLGEPGEKDRLVIGEARIVPPVEGAVGMLVEIEMNPEFTLGGFYRNNVGGVSMAFIPKPKEN